VHFQYARDVDHHNFPEQSRKHFGLEQVKLRWFLLFLPSMAKVALFAAGAVGVALAAWPLVSW